MFPVRNNSYYSIIMNSFSPPVRTHRRGSVVVTPGLQGFSWMGYLWWHGQAHLSLMNPLLLPCEGTDLGSRIGGQLGGSSSSCLHLPGTTSAWRTHCFSFCRLWLWLPVGIGMPAVSHKTLSSLNSPVKAWAPIKVARLSLGHESHTFCSAWGCCNEAWLGSTDPVAGLPAVTTHRKVRDVLAETQKHLKGGVRERQGAAGAT